MPDIVTAVQWRVIVTVLETPLTLTRLSLRAIVLVAWTPATLSCRPGGGMVTVFAGPPLGMLGWTLGMLGKLGMLMLGTLMVGNWRVDLPTMYHPTPAAMAMNTTAPIASTTHGMPAGTFRGGGAHGAP